MQGDGRYRVLMDGRWGLRDLYDFPHTFIQAYAFIYCFDSELTPYDASRINDALQGYPWGGGYSYVNIYKVLENQVNISHRPTIAEIKYASPGWMDILLHLGPAFKIGSGLASFAGSAVVVAKAYATIQKIFTNISLQKHRARLEHIQLTRQEIAELEALTREVADAIGFERVDDLITRTKSVEVAAKLVCSHYRRMKTLFGYWNEGKAYLPDKTYHDSMD